MRLDVWLVQRGFAPSRAKAQEWIKKGLVCDHTGDIILHPSYKCREDFEVNIRQHEIQNYVSRAALKLKGALERLSLSTVDRIAIDLGASTGGFCQVLLEYGCRYIHAIDVGHGQLHQSLRKNPNIHNLERTHVDHLRKDHLNPQPTLLTSDLSFISLSRALPNPLKQCTELTDLILLVKPQFELGPTGTNKAGLVIDPEGGRKAVGNVQMFLQKQGWETQSMLPADLAGSDGNQEYVLWAQRM